MKTSSQHFGTNKTKPARKGNINMKVTILKEVEFEAKHLHVTAFVRYWEDATINGQNDESGEIVPFKSGNSWMPSIDIDTGVIANWPSGTTASIHFKVCDGFAAKILDEQDKVIHEYDGYVPGTMCPAENGYGDYIIMNIGPDGKIYNWEFNIEDFLED